MGPRARGQYRGDNRIRLRRRALADLQRGEEDAFASLGPQTLLAPFGATLLRAVFAGWLIALMVWILPAVDSARPAIIIIITYVVAIAGLSHLIAGSVEAAYAVGAGSAASPDYWLRFFPPTLVGNVIGGVALVAGLNYGQVAPQLVRHAPDKPPSDMRRSSHRARREHAGGRHAFAA